MKFLLVLLSALTISFNASAIQWKSVFIAGDNSIENFDNGREDISQLLNTKGELSQVHLSSASSKISEAKGVWAANLQNISRAFPDQPVLQGEGCLVHMTSHGTKDQGFYIALSPILTPAEFSKMINRRCGQAPTVILVSACFSGQFITESLKGPNRVIMTAASVDRPSFGCSSDTRYTYWDNCLLEEIPRSQTWTQVSGNVRSCIQRRESQMGFPSSNPQSFIGTNAKTWADLL